jgi:hypothetical protein
MELGTLSEDEVETAKSRPKPKPAYKGRKDAPSDNGKLMKKAGPSAANRRDGRDDSEIEEAGFKSEKARGKRKARVESDVDSVEHPAEKKSRQKAAVDVEVHSAKPRSRGAGRAGSEVSDGAKAKRAKPTSRAEPRASAPEDEDNVIDDDSAPKKKKRKINIFPAAQPTSFPWGQLPQVGSCC